MKDQVRYNFIPVKKENFVFANNAALNEYDREILISFGDFWLDVTNINVYFLIFQEVMEDDEQAEFLTVMSKETNSRGDEEKEPLNLLYIKSYLF